MARMPTQKPPTNVRHVGRRARRANSDFAKRHAAHENDAEQCGEQAEHRRNDEIVTDDRHLLRPDDADLGRRKPVRHLEANERRYGDRRQTVGRIAADNEFEAVEGAGERSAERAGNAGRGAAPDQNAKIAAPQTEGSADARGDAARSLRVTGLQADRGAYAARPDCLQRDDHAAGQRHAAAVQRVGFDRVDLAVRPPASDDLG